MRSAQNPAPEQPETVDNGASGCPANPGRRRDGVEPLNNEIHVTVMANTTLLIRS